MADTLGRAEPPDRRRRQSPDEPAEPGPGQWTLEIYEEPNGNCPYATFLKELDPYQRTMLDVAVRMILARQGHNVCATEWGKALRGGLYEFRVRRSLATICQETGRELPPGVDSGQRALLRVFFAVEGARIVLLLAGYDKGADPSERRQNKKIKRAKKLLDQHRETQRRSR